MTKPAARPRHPTSTASHATAARAPAPPRRRPRAAAASAPPASRVANTIRRLRFEHGEMTQAALAGQVGVTRQAIIAIEGGRYAPSLELAFRIAAAFDRPLEEVFSYRPE